MKQFNVLFLLLFLSCSSTKIVYDYDVSTNFKQYKTYSFLEEIGDGMNNLDINRFIDALDSELTKAGIKKAEQADIFINFSAKKMQPRQNENVSVGISGGGGNIGIGISKGFFIRGKMIEEELTIDFIDVKTDQLIWQGISVVKIKEQMTPQKRTVYFKEIIAKILSKYPPKKK